MFSSHVNDLHVVSAPFEIAVIFLGYITRHIVCIGTSVFRNLFLYCSAHSLFFRHLRTCSTCILPMRRFVLAVTRVFYAFLFGVVLSLFH